MDQKGPDFLKAGDVVARRYVILRYLREEPCGDVWLAQDRSLGVDVGLKFMPRQSPHFEAAQEALRREGALAFKLRHPLILQAFHFEEGDQGVFLIQEPFGGESLLAHLNRLERFRLPYALGLLEQVAQALAFAHLQQEVHHSLDPSHVLLEGHLAKLANFACTRPAEKEEQVTHLELKAYTPPEVLQGEPVTPAANVFSLGVLGFRLAAGSLPYALTFDEPFPYRLESVPVDLEEIPLPLQNLLLQCLAPDPQDRFEDAGVFLAYLEQRREDWRTSSRARWFGWGSERESPASGVMESLSRTWGQLRDGSKNAVGRITEGFKNLNARGESGIPRQWLIGLVAGVLALILLFWGARALFLNTGPGTTPPSAPAPAAPSEATPPKMGGPPLSAADEPGSGRRRAALSVPKAPPAAPPKAVKATRPATPRKGSYQLLVVTYLTYEEARAMKKRIREKGLPSMVYRVTVKKKPYYVVKAGPFPNKERAQEVAQRLKKEEHLTQVPKIVKLKAPTALKTSPR